MKHLSNCPDCYILIRLMNIIFEFILSVVVFVVPLTSEGARGGWGVKYRLESKITHI